MTRRLRATGKVRCLITGKVVATKGAKEVRKDGVIMGDTHKLPDEVKAKRIAEVAQELADLRQHWVELSPGQRQGRAGDKCMREYRQKSLEFVHLAGHQPPPVYADM